MPEEKDAYLERLYEIHHYGNTEFDKNVLYIASGALGLTMTFIEKIVPLHDTTTHAQVILFIGWLSLTGSIVTYLLSHRCSKISVKKMIAQYKLFLRTECAEDAVDVLKEKCNRDVNRYNDWSAIFLITGILFILSFIYINI